MPPQQGPAAGWVPQCRMTPFFPSSTRLAIQLTEMALATPQVIALRLTHMALASLGPGASERQELHRMGSEKVTAFSQAWMAMCMKAWMMPLRLVPAFSLALNGRRSPGSLQQATAQAATEVLAAGVVPVHRTLMANARRLGKKGSPRAR